MPGPPLISVVVPVYDVAGYLAECLQSVLGQPFGDVEVIAVDGGSADASGRILDEFAREDPRLRVLHYPKIGPGRARNEGLAQAAGEYVWFVDADDTVAQGSIEVIAHHLAQFRPDVLLIDFERRYAGGRTRPSQGESVLRAAPPSGYGTIAEQPRLVNHTMTAWSKVIRREFLISTGTSFPDGIHEDIPVSCAVLLGASRIGVLDRVCYRYGQGRHGAFMGRTTLDHFDVFRSYRGVLEQAAKRRADGDPAITAGVLQALFERAIWHYAAILGTGGWGVGPVGISGLVPRRQRHRFFTMMNEDFVKYRPEGYRFPDGARGAKLRLIERNAYWPYSLAEPLNRLRVQALSGPWRTARSRWSRPAP